MRSAGVGFTFTEPSSQRNEKNKTYMREHWLNRTIVGSQNIHQVALSGTRIGPARKDGVRSSQRAERCIKIVKQNKRQRI
jgi:hypothetical protein